ncbi:histidine kinase dimerization/phosphoacceptor domain -containing protein [uncultured Muriicola sp.]|uniref:histidine kinase dimerization/phosphoacceptor domain -containing protein n=1 Tax=uncultured Muriicola sp. TaxID=1583102 RepID=UPI0026127214|nr:histidine kinase dimerization/phosphoacceptor domain -containing protein [uncultured Muriicola sp.]
MRNRFFKVVLITFFALLHGFFGATQLIDFDKENSYKRVFIDTDNFGPSYLDTLQIAYTKAPTDSLKFMILNDLAYYWHTRDLKKAYEFTKIGLRETTAKDCLKWLARFRITQGAILLRNEQLDSAQITLDLAQNHINKKDLPFLYTQLGYVYERRGDLTKAAEYALRSLRLGEQLNDLHARALAHSDLSNLFWKQGKYDKGIEQGLLSLTLFETIGMNDLDYDFTLYVMGNNYLANGELEKARTHFEHAIAIGERYGFYNNLSDVYISLADLYGKLNKYTHAEEAALKAISFSEQLNNNFMLMRAWLSLGKLQNLQGKYLSAVISLQKSIEVATADFGDAFYLSEAYQNLGRAFAGSHSYKEAYLAFERYDELKKEVFTAEAAERMSQIQTEFDVAKKENTILLQDTQIKKQQAVQTLIMIVSILLFLFLLLLFKAVRNNKRKNKLLQIKNEEKEFLLKEIHHRVKNNLEIVTSLLSLQSEQIRDPKIREAMVKSQQRVQSMSMIHQKLYQGNSLSQIEMKDYFNNLGNHVIQTYGMGERIAIECDMDVLYVDIDHAIPIGLIVNELLSNALKYAFPNNSNGKICIRLQKHDSILHLEVSDNGIGKSASKESVGTGFGTQLIALLTAQLDGVMNLAVDQGTVVTFDFQLPKAA